MLLLCASHLLKKLYGHPGYMGCTSSRSGTKDVPEAIIGRLQIKKGSITAGSLLGFVYTMLLTMQDPCSALMPKL